MDGRRLKVLKSCLALGTLAILGNSVGCRWLSPKQPDTVSKLTPAATGHKDWLGRERGFVPKAPVEANPTVMANTTRKKAMKSLSPETEIAFAEPEVDAAIDEEKSPTERDALLDQARQRYQRVLKTDPRNKVALTGLARLYTVSNQKEKAVEMYREAMKHNPKDHEVAFRMSRMYMHFEDWNAAAETCKMALKLDPENLRYHKAIALCTARGGNLKEAYVMLTERMNEADASFFLGRILLDMGRMKEGQDQMMYALKVNPNHANAREVLTILQSDEQSNTQQASYQQK